MKNFDVELSKKVAEEASGKIIKVKKELEENKDAFISFLIDVSKDSHEHSRFLRRVIISLFITITILIGGMIALSIYNQHTIKKMADDNTQKLTDFINQFDFYSEVEILNELSDYNNNNLNITR